MNMDKILRYRSCWMGAAMLWIIYLHSNPTLSGWLLNHLRVLGFAGVDIFLFASGAGCCYSLTKDADPIRFLKRRFVRIMPTYWCFLVFWIAQEFWAGNPLPFRAVLGNFLCVQNFTGLGNDFNWYISALWLMYLLAPLFKGLLDRIRSFRDCLGVLAVLILFSVPFWNSNILIITVTRIPVFFLGMYFCSLKFTDEAFTGKKILFLFGVMLAGIAMLEYFVFHCGSLLWSHGLWWYPFILITPGLCTAISCAADLLQRTAPGKLLEKFLSLLGKYSFEIYLVHVLLFEIYNHLLETGALLNRNLWRLYVVLLTVPGCILLTQITKAAKTIFSRFRKIQA